MAAGDHRRPLPDPGPGGERARHRRWRDIGLIALPVVLAIAAIVLAAIFLVRLSHGQSVPVVIPQHAPSRTTFVDAPSAQPGTFGHDGYECAPAARNRYLPRRSGCVSGLYADVEGTGHPDLVLLFARLGRREGRDYEPAGYRLEVVPPHGPAVSAGLGAGATDPSIVRVGRFDGTADAQLIVQPTIGEAGGSVNEIYVYADHRLRALALTPLSGSDSADVYGFTCTTGPAPTLQTRAVTLIGPTIEGRWRWRLTTYRWRGSTLRRSAVRRFVRRGRPPSGTAAAGCGARAGG